MSRKAAGLVMYALSFGVLFFDNLYKLEVLEWLPEVLSAILIAGGIYLRNPQYFKSREGDGSSDEHSDSPEDQAS